MNSYTGSWKSLSYVRLAKRIGHVSSVDRIVFTMKDFIAPVKLGFGRVP